VVPEQGLDHSDIRAALEEMGGEAVAQRVQRHRLPDPGGGARRLEETQELARRQAVPAHAAREQPAIGQRHAGILAGRAALGAALVAVAVQFVQEMTGAGATGFAAFQLMQGQRILMAIVIAAFATLWGEATILLFFVLPLKARWFLWLEILFAFIGFLESKDFAGFCGICAAVFLTYTGLQRGGVMTLLHTWRKRTEVFVLQRRLERLKKKRRFEVIDGDKDDYIH